MKLLGGIGHFMLGLGVLIYAISVCIFSWLGKIENDRIGRGTPPGTYEDDTKWDFEEY